MVLYLPATTIGVVPAAPVQLSATESAAGEVDLTWAYPVNLAEDFNLTVYGSWGEYRTYQVDSATFAYAVTGLTPDETYMFSLTADAHLNDGASAQSLPITLTAAAPATTFTLTGPTTYTSSNTATLTLNADDVSQIQSSVFTWNDGSMVLTSDEVDPSATPGPLADPYPAIDTSTSILNASVSVTDTAGYTFTLPDFAVTIVPAAPTNLFASTPSTSANEIDLSWNNISSFVSYNNIYISTDGTTFSYFDSVASDVSTYEATGLTPGTSYTFEVFAMDANRDQSVPSNTAAATTTTDSWDAQATGATTADEAAAYQLSLSVDPATSSPTFDHWIVDWGDGSAQSIYTSQTQIATHVFATSIDSTIIDIAAVTATGAASPFMVTPASIAVDMVPLAPANLQSTAISPNQIDLSWTNNSHDADGYTVLRSLDDGATYQAIADVGSSDTTYSDINVTPSTSAIYKVRADSDADIQDAGGSSGSGGSGSSISSASPSVTTPATGFNGQPTISVSADPADITQALVTYTYPATNDLGFEIEMEDESTSSNFYLVANPGAVDSSGQGTQTITGLLPDDTYVFRIRADHKGGTASKYVTSDPFISDPWDAPTLTVSADVFDNTTKVLRVGWLDVPDGAGVQLQVKGTDYAGNVWRSGAGIGVDYEGMPSDTQSLGVADLSNGSDGLEGVLINPMVLGAGNYLYRIRIIHPGTNLAPSEWSEVQSGSLALSTPATGSISGFTLTSTNTTITATWQSTLDPGESIGTPLSMYQEGDVIVDPINNLYAGGASDPATYVYSGGASDTTGNGSTVTQSCTMSNLIPGTTYDFVLYNYADVTYSPFQIRGNTTAMSITTTGVSLTVPAVPGKVWAVALEESKVEIIWHNSSNNEDGFIIQRSLDPNFVNGVTEFWTGVDETNYIDSSSYSPPISPSPNGLWYNPNPVYYRVAAYKGNAQSAWVSVSITPFHLPTAMAISWMENTPTNTLLNAVDNPAPPSSFSPSPAGIGPSLLTWELEEQYRDILIVAPFMSVDPYTGQISSVSPIADQMVGYTPGPFYNQGQGDMTVTGPTFNADHTQATIVALARFRVGPVENFGFSTFTLSNRLPWAWAKITYMIDAQGNTHVSFSGSAVPSQTDYLDKVSTGGYSMLDDQNGVDGFFGTPYGGLGPVDNRPQ